MDHNGAIFYYITLVKSSATDRDKKNECEKKTNIVK